MAYEDHQREARPLSARCAIVTLSDTRTAEKDKSGLRVRELREAEPWPRRRRQPQAPLRPARLHRGRRTRDDEAHPPRTAPPPARAEEVKLTTLDGFQPVRAPLEEIRPRASAATRPPVPPARV